MRIAQRVATVGKKTTLLATAFVLAVSTLTAAVPFILSEKVGAVESNTAEVRSEAELIAAANDTSKTIISVKKSFDISEKIVFSGRNVYIDGNLNTINFTANTKGEWNGDYVIQAYQITLGVKNLTVTGGDAAIYANGSTLNVEGTLKVTRNEYGGIEVSQGTNVTRPAVLNILNGGQIVNTTEATGKPTVWVDKASTANATVNGSFTETTHIGVDQKQYYLLAANAGVVAKNTSLGKTYASVQAAVDGASFGNVIELTGNNAIDQMVRITKPITLDGKGYALSANYSYTINGVDNAVITVDGSLASGTVIKNLTTTNTSTGQKPHGVVVQNAGAVRFESTVFKNGRAGAIINGSQVTASNVTTQNNSWYGINVDGIAGKLTISGANTHSESAALYVDNRATATVVDTDKNYVKRVDPNKQTADYYVYDNTNPVIGQVSPEQNGVVKAGAKIKIPVSDNEGLRKVAFNVEGVSGTSRTLNIPSGAKQATQEVAVSGAAENNLGLVDGTYTIKISVEDLAGNYTVRTHTFTIDNIKPKTVSATVTPGKAKPTDLTQLHLVLTDEDSTVVSAKYDLYNTASTTALAQDVQVVPTNGSFGTPTVDVTGTIDTSSLTTGTYRLQIFYYDAAGNMGKATASFEVDSRINAEITDIQNVNTATPTFSGTATWELDGTPITVDQNVVLKIDEKSYPVNEVAGGTWSFTLPEADALSNGGHEVTLFVNGDPKGTTEQFVVAVVTGGTEEPSTPPTPAAPGNGTPQEDPASSEEPQTQTSSPTALPSAINPGVFAQILGAATQVPSANAESDADVEGTSTENIVAQALNDTDSSDGSVFGLAWYWWLVILAAVAAIIWGIVAAFRGRQSV